MSPSKFENISLGRTERDLYFTHVRRNVAYFSHKDFVEAIKDLPHPNMVAMTSIITIHHKESDPLYGIYPYIVSIYVDEDYYKWMLGRDFTDMMPFDFEHELWETYFVLKRGYNLVVVESREKGEEVSTFKTPHYLAVRQALRKAHREGRLEEYLTFIKDECEYRLSVGSRKDSEERELKFYRKEAEKIRTRTLEIS